MKAELKRMTEERDILKGRRVLCQAVRVRYEFVKQHEQKHSMRRMCKVMQVHPSGYYAWKTQPQSLQAKGDQRLLACSSKGRWRAAASTVTASWHWICSIWESVAASIGLRACSKLKACAHKRAIGVGQGSQSARSCLIICSGSSMSPNPTSLGSPIAPKSDPTKAGSTWQSSSTCLPRASSNCSSASASVVEFIYPEAMHEPMSSTTSRCSTTHNADIRQ